MADNKTEIALLKQAQETTTTSLAEVKEDVKKMREELAAMPAQLKLAVNETCVTRKEFRAVKTVAGVVATLISGLAFVINKLLGP